MELKDMAEKYLSTIKKIEELQKEKWNLERIGQDKFGFYEWSSAIGNCPIVEKDGKVEVYGAYNVCFVAECLKDLADKRGKKLTCSFNETDLIAYPGNTVNNILADWDYRRIGKVK